MRGANSCQGLTANAVVTTAAIDVEREAVKTMIACDPGVHHPQRRGPDLKARSLTTVAMLIALGKPNELNGHVRGALNKGATVEEIQDVLLHASIYCGVPSAVEAFRSAAEVADGPKATWGGKAALWPLPVIEML